MEKTLLTILICLIFEVPGRGTDRLGFRDECTALCANLYRANQQPCSKPGSQGSPDRHDYIRVATRFSECNPNKKYRKQTDVFNHTESMVRSILQLIVYPFRFLSRERPWQLGGASRPNVELTMTSIFPCMAISEVWKDVSPEWPTCDPGLCIRQRNASTVCSKVISRL